MRPRSNRTAMMVSSSSSSLPCPLLVVFCFVGVLAVVVSVAADDAWKKTSTQTGARSTEVAPRLSSNVDVGVGEEMRRR